MSNANSRSKYWCFTLNNPTEEELSCVKALGEEGQASYLIFGREKGDNGTPHLQGYIEFARKIRRGGVKKLPGLGRAHLEVRRGTAEEASRYCQKENDFQIYGDMAVSEQGARNDLLACKLLIDGGGSEQELWDTHFGCAVRYHKAFREYRNLKTPRALRDVKVYVLVGEPGTGKTRFVWEREGAGALWINSCPSLKWFDGYGGEEAVLFDDYRGGADDSTLLRLLDRYPLKVAIKGGFVPWVPQRIYITSNIQPPFGHDSIAQPLRRRIRSVVQFTRVVDFERREEVEAIALAVYGAEAGAEGAEE